MRDIFWDFQTLCRGGALTVIHFGLFHIRCKSNHHFDQGIHIHRE